MLSTRDDPSQQLAQRKKVQELTQLMSSATTVEALVVETQAHLIDLFQCERTTLFAVDTKDRTLYSLAKTGAEFKEIRVALDPTSIAGFVGVAKKAVNLPSVYEAAALKQIHPQLQFDDRWDKASGFVTRAMLCVPVLYESNLLGVLQIINRKDRAPFSARDMASAEELGRSLATAFFNLNRMRALKDDRKPTRWDGLIDSGAVSENDLARWLGEAKAQNLDPARVLMEKAGVPRSAVEQSLSFFYDCEVFRFTGSETIPEDLRKKVKPEYLKQIVAAPLSRGPGTLQVVIDDPHDLARADALRALELGLKVDLRVGTRDDILALIDNSYGMRQDVGQILRQMSTDPDAASTESSDSAEVADSDSAVIKLANQIIADAYKRGCSDIHIEPNGKDRPTTVRFRLDGDCTMYQDIPAAYRGALVARIKIMANLDISERRKPQDGKIRLKLSKDHNLELRVATIPTANGNEDVVMRILAASKPLPLAQMGLSERNLRELIVLAQKPYGLLLVVGPTGSGKTTTLHSVLGHINMPDMKIWTAEDPVEITQPGLRQVQVQPKIGFTFEIAMRAFLRADPDVIMVGEMRDKETAETGIEASLTGHLVLSTLHTNSAPETVTRLLDMELDPFSFADSLLGVLAQRLARTLCKQCKQQYAATPDEYAEIASAFGGPEELTRQGLPYGPDFLLWRGAGCEACGGTGYKGRLGIHELLVTTDDLKRSVAQKAPVEELRRQAILGGMTTLLQDGIQKAIMGHTDLKSVLAVCSR